MERILELLGLEKGAGEDPALERIEAMASELESLREKAGQEAGAEVLRALGLSEGATISEITGTITAFKKGSEKAEELARSVGELERQLSLKNAGDLVSAAMREGKVTPAQKDWATGYAKRDPEGFSAFVAKAPVVLGMSELAGSESAEKEMSAPADATQLAVNRMLEIDEETFLRHNSASL